MTKKSRERHLQHTGRRRQRRLSKPDGQLLTAWRKDLEIVLCWLAVAPVDHDKCAGVN